VLIWQYTACTSLAHDRNHIQLSIHEDQFAWLAFPERCFKQSTSVNLTVADHHCQSTQELNTTVHFYASTLRSVAGGIMVLSCLSVRACMHPCVHPETLLTRYLAEYLTHFHQTYTSDALLDGDERFTIWGQRSRSWWNKVCWKQHFLALLTWCLEQW